MRKVTLVLCSLVASQVAGWKSEGHYLGKAFNKLIILVARIAFDKLQKESPSSITKANKILATL